MKAVQKVKTLYLKTVTTPIKYITCKIPYVIMKEFQISMALSSSFVQVKLSPHIYERQ